MRALTKKNILIFVGILLTFAIVQGLISVGIISSFHEITIALICINIIMAVSLNLITGFTGQFSLGHAGFMSIGAYVCALIIMRYDSTAGFLMGILAGALVATIVGILIGIPTLRLKGDYLAIATLGMAEIIRVVFLNLEITNGAAGLSGIPRHANWFWLFFFAVITVLTINNFIRSSHGRACISIREDEIAAESMGINTTKYKVMAFAIGAFFAGVGGALYASYFYFLKPNIFGFMKSIDILVIVVLGGLGSVTGSVVAAILLALLTTFLQAFTEIRMILYALLLVVIMIFRPQGLFGTKEINDFFKFRKKHERIE
ncbi:MAG: branched-chain amino acid ABC transporter permease [Clostridia bacterium]|jgi:branched-chain amino acid transport system permease protein|nr:branched-chain amino acid ABC transporter permease [Clostridia bacterium]